MPDPTKHHEGYGDNRWAYWKCVVEYAPRPWLTEVRGCQTIEEIAARSDLKATYLSELEDGKRMPLLPTLVRIGAAYDVAPIWLAERFLKELAA